jgi:gluconate 5-dehydrogenase
MTHALFDLTGKIALITGSSQGIGFGIARGLGQAGATIILNGRNEERLNRAVSTLSSEGLKVYGYSFDVSDSNQVDQKISTIEREVGPVDIMVNNAGIQRRGPLETIEESVWREVIETNLTAVFLTTKRVVKGMIDRRSGVKMLTRAMAVEWAKYNIQVNGIGPGFIVTEMNKVLLEDQKFDAMVKSRTPAGRWGQPSDLAGAAVLLASRASDYITGQIIYVEGGLLSAL